jgi:hypothetical protein
MGMQWYKEVGWGRQNVDVVGWANNQVPALGFAHKWRRVHMTFEGMYVKSKENSCSCS